MLKKKSDQLTALRAVSLFSSMSDRDLKAVLAGCREELYSDGQAIVREGQRRADRSFSIVEGQAKLTVGGKPRKTLGPGDYFGEIALIDKGPRAGDHHRVGQREGARDRVVGFPGAVRARLQDRPQGDDRPGRHHSHARQERRALSAASFAACRPPSFRSAAARPRAW